MHVLAVAALLAAATSCASRAPIVTTPPPPPELRFSLADIRLQSADTVENVAEVSITLHNSSASEVQLSRITYRLQVDTVLVGSGVLAAPIRVPANGSQNAVFPVRFTMTGLGPAGRAAIRRSPARFALAGAYQQATGRTDAAEGRYSIAGEFTVFP